MLEKKYEIIGRSGAGSLIAEFLFKELNVPYKITFTQKGEKKLISTYGFHPQGRIPVLICPDGNLIFETLAIVNHITARFPGLSPPKDTYLNDRYWQFLSLFATSLYQGYHRQHHSKYYVEKESYKNLRSLARQEQAVIYDFIETQLSPFVCGELLTAADFYLFMLTRWDLFHDELFRTRPKLKLLNDEIRARKSVDQVLSGQPSGRPQK